MSHKWLWRFESPDLPDRQFYWVSRSFTSSALSSFSLLALASASWTTNQIRKKLCICVDLVALKWFEIWNICFFSCFFREVFQAVFGQHGQQHLAVAELKHSSVPIIPSHAPPFVFVQPTARHTSMWCSTPQILANCNNMQQLISNCLLSLVCHTESYCIYMHITKYSCISSHGLQSASSLYLAWHTPNISKYQGVQHLLNIVKQSEQLDLSGPFQVEASFSLCQLSLQIFDFLAKVLKGVDGFTSVSKGHKKNMSKNV